MHTTSLTGGFDYIRNWIMEKRADRGSARLLFYGGFPDNKETGKGLLRFPSTYILYNLFALIALWLCEKYLKIYKKRTGRETPLFRVI